ncbi:MULTISPECIES: potassium-transporting ATPase subunit KdpC [Bacillaceae]|uniref:potassium-transporting ATPase subunit KdpC n=1 Tax=Bacillaceae TaxID=186817 RepID=UPI001E653C7A|nr:MULTISPECIES: potassium-transporting ATPase subunit KdpC [Bacillaceae]MCE4048715.1 potassium-transporting ATPase subunit KdpC [Bacillus sp. Au-Bac7]MCM3032849.1 potassium-transporting ATPase subunit KdpC [Niallia sp. MER 6]UPO90787.1 potassium-transporting ATPase subunit KdpC [Niallia sp. Man26]
MFATVARTSLLFMLICGVIYPLAVTGIAAVLLPEQANGSLVYNNEGKVIGSELIGQSFADEGFFHSRVSSIDYDASSSGTNNYAPTNEEMLERTKASITEWQSENPDVSLKSLPIDLITNSGSGLDPHITPKAALAQINRVAEHTNVPKSELKSLIERHTEEKEWGLFGEERVNVLKLNISLMELTS